MEGPTVRAVADKLAAFGGERISRVCGNTKIGKHRAEGETVADVFSRGKNLMIQFPDFSFKIHFLMFGSYMIDGERDGVSPRLSLKSERRMVNFYNCSVKIIDNQEVDALYPDELDIISEKWNQDKVIHLASSAQDELICDLLLDQEIFLGVGNIIKNEALFMAGIHPLSHVGDIPGERLEDLTSQAREFSMLFYKLKRRDERLDSYLRIYRKRKCETCEGRVTGKKSGQRGRMSFFCPQCQQLYPDSLADAAGERVGARV